MNLISVLTALGFTVLTAIGAVAFHRGNVCRQKHWLRSTELATSKLVDAKARGLQLVPGCPLKNEKIHFNLQGPM